ncbi:MAG: glycerophosphodiester phosphodiesterase [Thermomicrobiales bacterium]
MPTLHPSLPTARPLAIAHRAGNSLDLAQRALNAGADMLETDIWRFHERLEIRHDERVGPLPVLRNGWKVKPGWSKRLHLQYLLEKLPIEARIFLDLKGKHPELGEHVVEEIERVQPERQIILCGRTWPQLDAVADHPRVTRFYSVGTPDELAGIWGRLEKMPLPALSLNKDLATPELMHRLNEMGTTVICWTVNDPDEAQRLFARGVDGFTSDNLDLVARIARHRAAAFTAAPAP